jgi:hypothetical protein
MTPPDSATDRAWAAAAWQQARSLRPDLTSYGLGIPSGMADGWADGIPPDQLEEIAAAGLFLTGLPTVKPGPRSLGSYTVKHLAERWAGRYIREGALIAAALALGVPLRPRAPGHSVTVGLALRPLRARGLGPATPRGGDR